MYTEGIETVVKNAELLAAHTGADKEIVIIAAWLHDIASITDYSLYEMHHLHGARIAYELLNRLLYPPEKIQLVQKCIENHRGSMKNEKTSPEEICVADADAISHFDNIPSLLYLAYATKGMGFLEGKDFVKGKLNRSYQKLSENSKAFFAEKFTHAMDFLS